MFHMTPCIIMEAPDHVSWSCTTYAQRMHKWAREHFHLRVFESKGNQECQTNMMLTKLQRRLPPSLFPLFQTWQETKMWFWPKATKQAKQFNPIQSASIKFISIQFNRMHFNSIQFNLNQFSYDSTQPKWLNVHDFCQSCNGFAIDHGNQQKYDLGQKQSYTPHNTIKFKQIQVNSI